jgi:hypothetical protein
MCINWIRNIKVPKPDIVGEMTLDELQKTLKQVFGDIPTLIPDRHYELATLTSFYEFLKYDQTDKYLYTGDPGMDCDEFANCLHGNASIPKWSTIPIGTVWLSTPAHAVNFFIDENLITWYVEPQNDKMYKVLDKKGWIPYIAWL